MKTGNTVLSSVIIFFFSVLLVSCGTQPSGKPTDQEIINDQIVKVYFFHFSRRCTTCKAVEERSRFAVESLYPEQIKEGTILFEEINLEEESGAKIAEEMGVYGQALLIIHGKEKTDITTEGFFYATYKPKKLKQIIKKNIDPLLFH
jgi:hypothetical protein